MLFANCPNFANVVDKADGSLCGSIAFADTNVPEAIQELGPGVRPDPVSHGESHLVIPVTVALEERRGEESTGDESHSSHAHVDVDRVSAMHRYLWCTAEVTHDFSNVLHNCHVVLPAVIPELGSGELSPQNNCDA